MNTALILIVGRQPKQLERVCLETDRVLNDVRNLQLGIGLDPTRWQHGLHATVERVRKTWVGDHEISLSLAIHSQRLFVRLRREPVVKNARAAPDSDPTILQW